jgi:hypothetical protein
MLLVDEGFDAGIAADGLCSKLGDDLGCMAIGSLEDLTIIADPSKLPATSGIGGRPSLFPLCSMIVIGTVTIAGVATVFAEAGLFDGDTDGRLGRGEVYSIS